MAKRTAEDDETSASTRPALSRPGLINFTGEDGLCVLYTTDVTQNSEALLECLRSQPYMPKVSTFPSWPNLSSNDYVWTVDPQTDLAAHDAFYPFSRAHRNPLPPHPMPAQVLALRDVAFALVCKCVPDLTDQDKPNAALLNRYRDGNAKLSAHSDADPWLAGCDDGTPTLVLSISFGATRTLVFRHKKIKGRKHSFAMQNNSLLVMVGAETQANWTHEVPRESGGTAIGERYNITFRTVSVERVPLQMRWLQRQAMDQYREGYKLALQRTESNTDADELMRRLQKHVN